MLFIILSINFDFELTLLWDLFLFKLCFLIPIFLKIYDFIIIITLIITIIIIIMLS